jgi:anti-anti-sigma regulatory factor
MTTLQVDPDVIVQTLQEGAREHLPGAEGELVLDFSSVVKIDTGAARAMEELADLANRASVGVALRGVHAGVYRALKLLNLASKFSFVD